MTLLETILSKVMTEDPDNLSTNEILMASLYELKNLNEKFDVLKNQIEETSLESKESIAILELKVDKKILELEAKILINDKTRIENEFLKKVLGILPLVVGSIVSLIVIFQAIKSHFIH